ncbi:class I SAM-dependent methyltransferase [Nocardioides sp. LHG3406-4]|uniref:class I SAM-dependent methyltransferase n=1 Tax=Nocardioides sp. LHG3406-4 TaxID=2804575 RepID=UPI003CF98D39
MDRAMDQARIDAAIQVYYARQFDESARLTSRSAQGALELIRVQEMIADRVGPRSRILDIGGASGVHAARLAEAGHEVTLIDPVEAQVVQARRHGTFTAQVGDARRLRFEGDSFDAALLFGPLYHLHSPEERRTCLEEAARVVVAGGLVFVAAIPRFIRHAMVTLAEDIPHPYPKEWVDLLEHGTPTGGRFPAGHFHTAEELESELLEAGLHDVELCAIEGVAGLALEQVRDDDPELLAAALTLARKTGHLPGIRDITNHLMAIGRVREAAGRLDPTRPNGAGVG